MSFVRAGDLCAVFLIKLVVRLGEFHRVLAAHEKRHVQFLFEVLHLPAERWLGEVQNLGRTIERSVGCDGDEIAQMAKFHRATVAHTKSMSEPRNKALRGITKGEQNDNVFQ